MSEGDPGESEAGGGGSAWTTLPALLTAAAVLIGAIVSAVVTLRGGDGDAVAGSAGTGTTAAATTEQGPPDVPFLPVSRPAGRVYFEGDTMFVRALRPGRPMLALAESDEPLEDVRLRARAEWVSGARDYGVGFVCRYADAGNYYLLSVLSGGRYHIVRYRRGRPVSLTGGIQPSGAVDDEANDLDARCVGSDPVLLTLVVGGTQVASARDEDGIDAGSVGVRVGTSESVVTASFRNIVLRTL